MLEHAINHMDAHCTIPLSLILQRVQWGLLRASMNSRYHAGSFSSLPTKILGTYMVPACKPALNNDYALVSEMRLTVVVWEFYLSLYANADIYEVICAPGIPAKF